MNDQFRRFKAVEATNARYAGRLFGWTVSVTCAHLTHFHLSALGHTNLPRLPAFGSPLSAKRALKKLGWNDMDDALASMLEPIAPLSAMLGDLAVLDGSDGLGAVVINAGDKWLGWSETNSVFGPLVVFKIRQAFRG